MKYYLFFKFLETRFLPPIHPPTIIPNIESKKLVKIDPELPEGLVFKVQIGAFRKPMSENSFNGLEPLCGETSRPGWIRYCLGMFRTYDPAKLLKTEVRAKGYKDAFVVAYRNAERIPLQEAVSGALTAN